jgi:hypothetical protein
VTGSLENVVLRKVTVDTGEQLIVEDGCITRIDAATFDFAIEEDTSARSLPRALRLGEAQKTRL